MAAVYCIRFSGSSFYAAICPASSSRFHHRFHIRMQSHTFFPSLCALASDRFASSRAHRSELAMSEWVKQQYCQPWSFVPIGAKILRFAIIPSLSCCCVRDPPFRARKWVGLCECNLLPLSLQYAPSVLSVFWFFFFKFFSNFFWCWRWGEVSLLGTI